MGVNNVINKGVDKITNESRKVINLRIETAEKLDEMRKCLYGYASYDKAVSELLECWERERKRSYQK